MFEFTGLRILHQDMVAAGEKRVVFPFEYNEKHFSCIFLVDIIPFRIYLTTVGAKPLIFELEVNREYKVKSFIDGYKELISYLNLRYDPNHKFIPNDFFDVLNKKIPKKFTQKPNYKEVLIIASNRRNIEEIYKIYFCGWYTNPISKNVRPENLEKTRSAFGDEKAQMCSDKNISSCWTDLVKDENLKKLNELDKI